MTHYLSDWQARSNGLTMSVDQWNKMVDGFDVEKMAEQLQSVGAKYYQISIGQNSGYYISPNATYDKIVGIQPSKLSHRDLVADLYEALHKRGIKLMVYLPSGGPGQDKVADAALEWRNGPYPLKEFPDQSGNRSSGHGRCNGARRWRDGGSMAATSLTLCIALPKRRILRVSLPRREQATPMPSWRSILAWFIGRFR